ncbi:glutamine amidotransferase of anthranilate synthase or aminodeoxychorismate synthase [Prauserella sp. Am3]|nr:glutamine amidotransferase of anthranilate synthase or aminodeoxychorismate synthase [Prauserella sp. Am3]
MQVYWETDHGREGICRDSNSRGGMGYCNYNMKEGQEVRPFSASERYPADMRVLVVDNYDSFVYNLVQYLAQLGAEPEVWRNDVVDLDRIGDFDGVLVSPGPGTPERAGQSIDVINRCAADRVPMLGVCLGHQALGVAWGATVDRAPELLHGKTSQVHHDGSGVLAGLPEPFTATRYHSLTVLPETIPGDAFEVTGRTETGIVMGMRHRELPLEGVQFHPESVLTQGGHRMLANWMAAAGHAVDPGTVDRLEQATRALQRAAA